MESKFRTSILITLTTGNTAYSLLDRIIAADPQWTASAVAYLLYRVPTDGANIYEVQRGATGITAAGVFLISTESLPETSMMNDIQLGEIYLLSPTDGATLGVTVRSNHQSRT